MQRARIWGSSWAFPWGRGTSIEDNHCRSSNHLNGLMGSTTKNRTHIKPQMGLRLSPGPPLPFSVVVFLQPLHAPDSLSWRLDLPLQLALPPPPQGSVLSPKPRDAVTIWTPGDIQEVQLHVALVTSAASFTESYREHQGQAGRSKAPGQAPF